MKESHVRSPKASASVVALALVALAVASLPTIAQDGEAVSEFDQLERPASQEPVQGYTRSDGTLVLTDEGYCSYLMGALWGEQELTFSELIDKSKKQKKAQDAAFQPLTDAALLQECVDVLNAFRLVAPEEDRLPTWARSGPVVPEALAGFLPADLLNDPLAQPAAVGDGARTGGFGDLLSPPFALTGGAYFIAVDAAACESWSGVMRAARDPAVELQASDGQTYLYNVAPANYFWDVAAPDCDWTIDLVAYDIPPEPTPTPEPMAVVPALHGEKWVDNVAVKNREFLNAAEARAALVAAGLEVGDCLLEQSPPISPDRVWMQSPLAGTLLPIGSFVDVWIGQDCDIVSGGRIVLE
jgi:hypothetical protein